MNNKFEDFLLEIGCEELPAAHLNFLSHALGEALSQECSHRDLSHQKPHVFATPRRLAVFIPQLLTGAAPQHIERQGPGVAAAFDSQGMPTLACMGFAQACGVSVDQLQIRKSPKGERVYCKVIKPGHSIEELLPEILQNALNKLPLPKPMRWGNHDFSFLRPVKWLLVMLGDKTLPLSLFGLMSSHQTRGHRFHHPEPITIDHAKNYAEILKSQGHVIADFEVRKELIRNQLNEAAPNDSQTIINDALLHEVTGLVEWPVVLRGEFSEHFLNLPKEVLITSMATHQKCFPIENKTGELLPYFLLTSNIDSKNPSSVIKGNERVINARLADADFFYQNDLKLPLEARLEKLQHVVFQKQLGTIAARTSRISQLSHYIAKQLGSDIIAAARAGSLAKCDLVSEMVYEFPSLQGVMGYYYAAHDNEAADVAEAIKQHYWPRFSGDQLPENLTASSVALADRLDTLVGIFGINLLPTGDKDPFALRRAALGIIRILIEQQLPLDLIDLLKKSASLYEVELPNNNTIAQAFEFIMARLKAWYLEQGVATEVFDAVMACNPTQPLDFNQRLIAVQEFKTLPAASALAAANKRVRNILKKTDNTIPREVDNALLKDAAEQNLAKQLQQLASAVSDLQQAKNYTAALSQLANLKEPIDTFFDEVMVMTDDEAVRHNRLALLADLRTLFMQVADISLL